MSFSTIVFGLVVVVVVVVVDVCQMILELSVGYWAWIGSSSDHVIILPEGCWSWREMGSWSFSPACDTPQVSIVDFFIIRYLCFKTRLMGSKQ